MKGKQLKYFLMDDNLVTEEFRIKGMICSRCLKILSIELKAAGAEIVDIELGKIAIRSAPDEISRALIRDVIESNEFEVIWDKEVVLAEQLKRWVITYIWNTDQQENLSDYLVKKTNKNYDSLSKTFSSNLGKTLERYCVELKVERTKELIEDGELNFSDITYALGYQNLSALSRQFKRETGMTMQEYKKLGIGGRIPVDKL
jgi:YesN/AraC family two-component response regulator